jgi:hypothetical protein
MRERLDWRSVPRRSRLLDDCEPVTGDRGASRDSWCAAAVSAVVKLCIAMRIAMADFANVLCL